MGPQSQPAWSRRWGSALGSQPYDQLSGSAGARQKGRTVPCWSLAKGPWKPSLPRSPPRVGILQRAPRNVALQCISSGDESNACGGLLNSPNANTIVFL